MADLDHIAPFIRMRRAELGLSLDEVAERSGLSKSRVWDLEVGRVKNPTLKTAFAICEALQCSLSRLIGVDIAQPIISDQEMALITAHRRIFSTNPREAKD